jgi:DNA adenine methylase
MKTATRKLRPPIKRHGGKAYLARRIIARMPPHRTYSEPFLGGGSVLLNKPPAEREVAGDVDGPLIDLWRAIQEGPPFLTRVDGLSNNEATFADATRWLASSDRHVRALGFLVRSRFSRGGLGLDFAWSERLRGKRRPGGPIPGDVNAWETIQAELPRIAERVAHVEFHCRPALELIRDYDGPDTLFYVDPPYPHATRTARDTYDHEMTTAEHVELLKVLKACRGAVLLSGYRSGLYDAALAGWRRHEFDMPNHSGQGQAKQRRTECLWVKEATP